MTEIEILNSIENCVWSSNIMLGFILGILMCIFLKMKGGE